MSRCRGMCVGVGIHVGREKVDKKSKHMGQKEVLNTTAAYLLLPQLISSGPGSQEVSKPT